MAHDVFISHSKSDKAVADAMCLRLEQAGVRCWIAPRDSPGGSWGTEIIRGFDNAKVMIVVCASSNRSRPVFKAVESGFGKGIVIIPIRTEEVVPSEMLEFLSPEQWLDAITPLVKTHRDRLSSIVKEYLLEQGRTEGEGKAAGAWLHRAPTLLQREAKERLESIRRKRKRKRGQTLQ